MPRWIIRPRKISTTPRLLASKLGIQTRSYPSARNQRQGFNFDRDFFLVYPDPTFVGHSAFGGDDGALCYEQLYRFFSQSKAGQRVLLRQSGLPIPDTTSSQIVASNWLVQRNEQTGRFQAHQPNSFIVRPLRHSGGSGFRLTSDPTDFIAGQEYVQRLFPKTREYRLIYVKGQLAVTLRKKVREGTRADQPWNHAVGATFQTVNDLPSCKLTGTDIFTRLSTQPIIQHAHLVAVDVLYARGKYVICEFNSCPGLSIESNLMRIVNVLSPQVVHQP
ncbi:hypothetical protein SAMN05444169_7641 [Bradyrhizobium erythrophlei]|uniref:ATP-grasp domain-containing protein n=1 Tax=Bradyrhizobium erythrophlei TaxID=1437360 RepID=A0A1M5TA01_9BRAD|nr:hypothetical protein SAMN05444169_7641 [Bradyrhizobium erythrophlei]